MDTWGGYGSMAVALRTIEGSISSKLLLSETYHYENPWKLTVGYINHDQS